MESNDWASVPNISAEDESDFLSLDKESHSNEEHDPELDPENLDFGFDREDFEGLKKAIWEARMEREGLVDAEPSREARGAGVEGVEKEDDDLGDDDVKKVEQMMRKLQAVRDMSAGLPEEQRKRVAARAVGEVMRDL